MAAIGGYPMLKPALCAAALAVTAAIAIPAIAQQSPQGPDPQAAPNSQAAPEGRGPGWRGYPEGRYSDEDGPGRRARRFDEGRRWDDGRRDSDDDGPRRWRERRFG